MSGHLSKAVNELGRQVFIDWLDQNGIGWRIEDGDIISGKDLYKIRTKRAYKLKLKEGSSAQVEVQGMNTNNLENIRQNAKMKNKQIQLIFIDSTGGTIRQISLKDWDAGAWYEGVFFPHDYRLEEAGRILYFPVYNMPIIGKMNEAQQQEMISLQFKNKSDKHQKSLFDD